VAWVGAGPQAQRAPLPMTLKLLLKLLLLLLLLSLRRLVQSVSV
jgi:hypothetical protein